MMTEIQIVTKMGKMLVIKKVLIISLLIVQFFNCSNKQSFERNKNDEVFFKNTIINSVEKKTILASEIFQEEDKVFVFPPYFTLKEINKEVKGFSDTFYYLDRVKNDNIDVSENIYLIISTKEGIIKKCMPIERRFYDIERLKSNQYFVNKTILELSKSNEDRIKINFIEEK